MATQQTLKQPERYCHLYNKEKREVINSLKKQFGYSYPTLWLWLTGKTQPPKAIAPVIASLI